MSWWQDFSLIDCSPRKYHTCHKKIRAKPKNSIKSDFKDLLLDKKTIEVIAESSCRRWSVNSLLISANVENRPFNYLETQNDKTWFIKYLPGKENVCYDSKNFILPIFYQIRYKQFRKWLLLWNFVGKMKPSPSKRLHSA